MRTVHQITKVHVMKCRFQYILICTQRKTLLHLYFSAAASITSNVPDRHEIKECKLIHKRKMVKGNGKCDTLCIHNINIISIEMINYYVNFFAFI